MSNTDDADLNGWASIISRDPLVIATWTSPGLPLGLLSVPGALIDQACTVFILPTWSLEVDGNAKTLAKRVMNHVERFPHHRIIPCASNQTEEDVLTLEGLKNAIINANAFISDEYYHPIVGVEPEFDAIYNAVILPYKRHDLAEQINSLALLFYRNKLDDSRAEFHAKYAKYRQRMPQATFINPLTIDGCQFLSSGDVNMAYARSRVGLCLSPVEGAMRASIEYLMAGLPIVSIPNKGGRDYFFDPDFCLTVKDDSRSISEAVEALVRRNIPRDYIREQTLKRVQKERDRFASMVDEIIYSEGGKTSSLDRIQRLISDNKLYHYCECQSILDELTP